MDTRVVGCSRSTNSGGMSTFVAISYAYGGYHLKQLNGAKLIE